MALPKAAKSIVLMDGNGMISRHFRRPALHSTSARVGSIRMAADRQKKKIRQLPMMRVVDKLRWIDLEVS